MFGPLDEHRNQLHQLSNPGSQIRPFQTEEESVGLLCSLACLSWVAVSAPANTRYLRYSDLWERALDQWVLAHKSPPGGDLMILFHAIHLNFLVDLSTLQTLIAFKWKGDVALSKEDMTVLFCGDRDKARWHADQTLNQAADMLLGQRNARGQGHEIRPPHFTHIVMFAVLTLWCDSLLKNDMAQKATAGVLERGIALLRPTDHSPPVQHTYHSIFEGMLKTCRSS